MYDSGTIALIANSHDHIPGFAWIRDFKMKWPWHYFHVWTMFYSYTFSYNFFSMVDQDMQTRLNEQEWCWLCSWVFSSPKDSRDSPLMGSRRPKDLGTLQANQRGVGKTMVGDRNQFFDSKQEKINHGPLCEKVPCQQSAPWAKEDPIWAVSFHFSVHNEHISYSTYSDCLGP